MDLTPTTIALLCLAGLAAGTVDAIGGGGGLISLPALLAAGIPPHLALGTNKAQSVFGSFASLLAYARAGMVERRRALLTFPLGFVGALAGARLVLWVPPETLRPLVLALLVFVLAVLLLRPTAGTAAPSHTRLPEGPVAAGIAFALGTYDGFFGPGTGTFLILAFVALLGSPAARASADAKPVNFASNLASVLIFASKDTVAWRIALPMAAAQFAGGFLGARLAARRGDRMVRSVVLCVVVGLIAKLAYDLAAR
ncbi:MAG: TSUP family transporter [Planctomycetes bacterium]|nr:TSUP family transporter [Planctomycetota bacterium]